MGIKVATFNVRGLRNHVKQETLLLVVYDGEHPKRNMELSALIKIYYYIYVLTKKHDVSLLFSENI